jgi:hypothetical protein
MDLFKSGRTIQQISADSNIWKYKSEQMRIGVRPAILRFSNLVRRNQLQKNRGLTPALPASQTPGLHAVTFMILPLRGIIPASGI